MLMARLHNLEGTLAALQQFRPDHLNLPGVQRRDQSFAIG
jgi:hypothetical protein